MRTKIYKDYHGWNAETEFMLGSYFYKAITMKRSSGLSTCMRRMDRLSDSSVTFIEHEGRATEKRVKDLHSKVLKEVIPDDEAVKVIIKLAELSQEVVEEMDKGVSYNEIHAKLVRTYGEKMTHNFLTVFNNAMNTINT